MWYNDLESQDEATKHMQFPWWASLFGGLVWFAVLVILVLTLGTQAEGTHVARKAPRSLSEQRDSIVRSEAVRAGQSPGLMVAISHVENWSGDSMAVSKRGAVGIMQVLPSYWQHAFEPECGCGSLFNRRRNACIGVRVYAQYFVKYKTVPLALRAYHGSLDLHTAGDKYIEAVLTELSKQ